MMFFQVDDYQFWFEYVDHRENPVKVGHDAFAKYAIEAVVAIGMDEYGATAFCSVNDELDIDYGEQLSLSRLVWQMNFDDEFVDEIKEAYITWRKNQ